MAKRKASRTSRLRDLRDPMRVQHGMFFTQLSVVECEQIVDAHILPTGLSRLIPRRTSKRKPHFNGTVTDGKFSIRGPIPKFRRTESILDGTLHDYEFGTKLEVQFRVQIASTVRSRGFSTHLMDGDMPLPLFASAVALDDTLAGIDHYLLWTRRKEWDYYAWFLEKFLSATPLDPGSTAHD